MKPTPEQRITAARSKLLLDFPFWGSLSMRLKFEACPDIQTFDTNGSRIRYNPSFLAAITDDELIGVLAHETAHCAFGHPYRRHDRDSMDWNIACDYFINPELVRAGLKLPEGCLFDPQFEGLSPDTIYARIHGAKPRIEPRGGDGVGTKGQPDEQQPAPAPAPPSGNFEDAPEDESDAEGSDDEMSETDWQVATEQAANVARAAGKLPLGIQEKIEQARNAPEDWREILHEFIERNTPSDYSWTNPNRRHIANGLYLPGIVKENTGHIVAVLDTSGSVNRSLAAAFLNELQAIMADTRPEKLTVMLVDSRIHATYEYGPDDVIDIPIVGRGGTAFSPAFKLVNSWEEMPLCLIYFTDLDSYDMPEAPDYPVLWVTDMSVSKVGPFGQTVRMAGA